MMMIMIVAVVDASSETQGYIKGARESLNGRKNIYGTKKSKERREKSPWDNGRDPFNQNSNRSDREKWTTSKGGPVFSKLFRLDRTDPLSFGPKFPEILAEWIAPYGSCLNLLLFLPFSLPLPSPSSLLKLPTEDNEDTKFWGQRENGEFRKIPL